jgi:hypothetical protein
MHIVTSLKNLYRQKYDVCKKDYYVVLFHYKIINMLQVMVQNMSPLFVALVISGQLWHEYSSVWQM